MIVALRAAAPLRLHDQLVQLHFEAESTGEATPAS